MDLRDKGAARRGEQGHRPGGRRGWLRHTCDYAGEVFDEVKLAGRKIAVGARQSFHCQEIWLIGLGEVYAQNSAGEGDGVVEIEVEAQSLRRRGGQRQRRSKCDLWCPARRSWLEFAHRIVGASGCRSAECGACLI